MVTEEGTTMSNVTNLQDLRRRAIDDRRREVERALKSKGPTLAALSRLKIIQDIVDALDRAIGDEKKLSKTPEERRQIFPPPDTRIPEED